MTLTLLAGVVAVSLFIFTPGKDAFRLPKDDVVYCESIVLAAGWFLLAINGRNLGRRDADKPVFMIAGGVIGWTTVTALFAVNRTLSAAALGWAIAMTVVMLSIYLVMGMRRRTGDLWYLIVPATLNALTAMLQVSNVWQPIAFTPDVPRQLQITALIGNPNDVGAYLVAPLVACAALVFTSRRWRIISATSCILLALGLAAARSLTAIIAGVVGVFAVIVMSSANRKRASAIVITVVVIAVVAGAAAGRNDIREWRKIDVLNVRMSNRIPPFLSAWRMFLDHPFFGVGPGCFGSLYFDYKIAVEHDHPALFHSGQGWSNFAEVHNDHLEILSETGLPGYALFILVLVFLARHSFMPLRERGGADADVVQLARTMAFPLSLSLFVLCLAQFPLQLASSTSAFGFVAAAAIGWLRR